MSTDPRDPIIIRRPTVASRVRSGFEALGNWLASVRRWMFGA
jgi:hypothetical protein